MPTKYGLVVGGALNLREQYNLHSFISCCLFACNRMWFSILTIYTNSNLKTFNNPFAPCNTFNHFVRQAADSFAQSANDIGK